MVTRKNDAALVQSTRCTETAPPLVMNPRIESPGTGVQHLASLTWISLIPLTRTPASPVALVRRRVTDGAERSATCSSACSSPPRYDTTLPTSVWAEMLFSPTAAYN